MSAAELMNVVSSWCHFFGIADLKFHYLPISVLALIDMVRSSSDLYIISIIFDVLVLITDIIEYTDMPNHCVQ